MQQCAIYYKILLSTLCIRSVFFVQEHYIFLLIWYLHHSIIW